MIKEIRAIGKAMKLGWIVLSVLSGSEMKTASGITESGLFECYCPTRKTWLRLPRHIAKKEGRSRRLIESPLLNGYVFGKVQYEDLDLFRLKLKFKELFGPMRSIAGNVYARDEDVETLKALQSQGRFDADNDSKSDLKMRVEDYVGRSVMVISGLFEGLEGEVVSAKGNTVQIDAERKIWVNNELIRLTAA